MEINIYYGPAEDQFSLDGFDNIIYKLGGKLKSVDDCVKVGIFFRRNLREIHNYNLGDNTKIRYLRYRYTPKHPWRTSIDATGDILDINCLEKELKE